MLAQRSVMLFFQILVVSTFYIPLCVLWLTSEDSGTTSDHCGTGCQSSYGTCGSVQPPTAESFERWTLRSSERKPDLQRQPVRRLLLSIWVSKPKDRYLSKADDWEGIAAGVRITATQGRARSLSVSVMARHDLPQLAPRSVPSYFPPLLPHRPSLPQRSQSARP